MCRQEQPRTGEDPTVCHSRQIVSKGLCTRTQCRSLWDEVTEGTRSNDRSKIGEGTRGEKENPLLTLLHCE